MESQIAMNLRANAMEIFTSPHHTALNLRQNNKYQWWWDPREQHGSTSYTKEDTETKWKPSTRPFTVNEATRPEGQDKYSERETHTHAHKERRELVTTENKSPQQKIKKKPIGTGTWVNNQLETISRLSPFPA